MKTILGPQTPVGGFGSLTRENLAQKIHFLLEIPVRELLMAGLHEVLARIEEILKGTKKTFIYAMSLGLAYLWLQQRMSRTHSPNV